MIINHKKKYPKISCLMITANRLHLAKRAIQCFSDQIYPNKELVIIDDGEEDYGNVLNEFTKLDIKYIKIDKEEEYTLGYLRNCSLNYASGDYIVQWDDDDWYHPNRLEIQASILNNGFDACCLSATIMHINTKKYMNFPFIGQLREGVPGSIMHIRDDSIRYSNLKRAEDTYYLREWSSKNLYILDISFYYLFIRTYHGDNTWEIEHFLRRLRNTTTNWLKYMWYFKICNTPFKHPDFRISNEAGESYRKFIYDSKKFDLL